jgi:hypothetical protein
VCVVWCHVAHTPPEGSNTPGRQAGDASRRRPACVCTPHTHNPAPCMLCCAVLCCAVLCCAVLCCAWMAYDATREQRPSLFSEVHQGGAQPNQSQPQQPTNQPHSVRPQPRSVSVCRQAPSGLLYVRQAPPGCALCPNLNHGCWIASCRRRWCSLVLLVWTTLRSEHTAALQHPISPLLSRGHFHDCLLLVWLCSCGLMLWGRPRTCATKAVPEAPRLGGTCLVPGVAATGVHIVCLGAGVGVCVHAAGLRLGVCSQAGGDPVWMQAGERVARQVVGRGPGAVMAQLPLRVYRGPGAVWNVCREQGGAPPRCRPCWLGCINISLRRKGALGEGWCSQELPRCGCVGVCLRQRAGVQCFLQEVSIHCSRVQVVCSRRRDRVLFLLAMARWWQSPVCPRCGGHTRRVIWTGRGSCEPSQAQAAAAPATIAPFVGRVPPVT